MRRTPAFWAILVATVALGVYIGHRSLEGRAFVFYMLIGMVPFLDTFDFAVRLHMRRLLAFQRDNDGRGPSMPLDVGSLSSAEMRLHLRPYAVVVSVFNVEGELESFLRAVAPFRDRVYAIDDGSTDDTLGYLERAGVRAVRSESNRKKPAAIRALLRSIPSEVETVLVVDPDVRFLDRAIGDITDLERVIFEFQRSQAAALCPRIVVAGDGLLSRLQRLEYTFSFGIGRQSLAEHNITSGVAIYRRDALEAILEEHSLSVYAEDLENAVLLLMMGENVYYDDRLTIETDGPQTWPHWFSQRVGWSFGLLKVCSEQGLHLIRRMERRGLLVYHYFIYLGLFSLVMHPLKLVGLTLIVTSFAASVLTVVGWSDAAAALPGDADVGYFVYLQYTFLSLVALAISDKSEERWRLLPVVPLNFFYVLANLIPATLGYANWLTLHVFHRRIYADHYQDEASLRREVGGVGRRRQNDEVHP